MCVPCSACMFRAQGYDGSGSNNLGRLLMRLRDELLAEQQQQQQQPGPPQ